MAAACHMTTPPPPPIFYFWRIKTEVVMLKIQLCHHINIFLYIQIELLFYQFVFIFIKICIFPGIMFPFHFIVEIINCIFSAICLCSFFLRPQAVWLWTIFRSKGGSVHVQSHSELRLRVCLPLVGWSVSQRKGSGEYCVLTYQYCPVKADDVHALQIISNEMRANIISIQISTADSDAHLIIQSSDLSRSLFIDHELLVMFVWCYL